MKRIVASILAAFLVIVCAGCVGIPRSGVVQEGKPITADDGLDITFIPSGPQPGSTPEQVLRGFIAAATGPQNNYAVAREYLAPGIEREWRPDVSVLVDASADRRFEAEGDAVQLLSVYPEAQVDASGLYERNPSDNPVVLTYGFEQVEGEWRISSAPDGIVLDASTFTTVFGAHALMFFDPTWTYLVPDIRWFPTRASTATTVVKELLDGPAPWLSGGVRTAFPDGTALSTQSVTVDGDVVRMDFSSGFTGENAVAQSRMRAQLSASLTGIGMLGPDSISSQGAVVDIDILTVPSPRVDARALVLAEEGFGFLSGDVVERIDGLSPAVEGLAPSAVSVGVGLAFAAALTTDGVFVVPSGGEDPLRVDARGRLIAPTVDPFGYTWSVPQDDPGAILAFRRDGSSTPVETPWPEASSITSLQVSRDGTRIAALVTTASTTRLVVAAVTRSEPAGPPTAIGDLYELDETLGSPLAVTWVDDRTVASLTEDEEGDGEIEVYTIGSSSTIAPALAGATTVVGANTPQQIRALLETGEIRVRSGSGWQTRATGILVLATQLATLG
ncbi:hypothetical protein ELQ92_04950 [Labedella populi]|uniref:GerMN domain-containing protein n=1 Tax=Labedella populi TaxID=2498850 RepID=A0A3S4BE44_9MICO|nr:LpqB family beta-propeller domain-containing protein [Labedella populi]RWZ68555.1 hypothetical protein ELQ92_04950 [Labedella populi]